MRNKAFITSVLLWKVAGATTWALLLNLLVSNILSTFIYGGQYLVEFHYLSIICSPILIYTYIRTLKSVPVPAKLLNLKEAFFLVLWAIVYIVYSFLVTSSAIIFPYSILMSSFASFIYIFTQGHSFYFAFNSIPQSRFRRFCNNFRSHLLLSIIVGVVFLPLAGLPGFFISIQLFLSTDVIFSIATVVASESVSFSSSNNKRLIDGLNSHDSLQKYLAYADVYSISGGNSLRRRFLFKDPSSHVFASIVEACRKLLKEYSSRIDLMLQMGNTKAPIHLINDSQWRRSQFYRPTGNSNIEDQESPSLFSKILSFFFSNDEKIKRNEQIKREANALQFSTLVIYAVQSLVRFLSILPSEDKFGIGQIYVENILNILLTTKISLDKAANYAFISAPYESGWFARNPTDLKIKTKKTVDWAVNEILRHFKNQLNYSKLTPSNLDLAEHLIGRKLNHRDKSNNSLFGI